MNKYSFSDLSLGKRESFNTHLTIEDLFKFKAITGDINPLHCDIEFAKKHGYPNQVVYGMLTASFLSTLAGVYLPGERSLIQEVNVKFIAPVFPNDDLNITGEIIELNDTVEQIVIEVSITATNKDISNGKSRKVVRGKMKIGILNE